MPEAHVDLDQLEAVLIGLARDVVEDRHTAGEALGRDPVAFRNDAARRRDAELLSEAEGARAVGYGRLRRDARAYLLDTTEGGALPKKFKELVVLTMNILQNSVWGIHSHARAAIIDGATIAGVAEIVVLTIPSRGMVAYRMGGYGALIAAERALAEQRRRR